jgi:hypothetical protein
MLPCALGTSAAVAGTPLEIRGTTTSGDAVNASAWRDGDKTVREATVATLDGTWRAIFLFGAADGGEWTVQVSVDGTERASRLTVALPPGMVAPPTGAPAPEPDGSSSGGFDGYALRTLAVNDGVALVLASWIFLALVRLVHTTGRRPLARPGVRRVATVAVFVAVLGAVLAVWIECPLLRRHEPLRRRHSGGRPGAAGRRGLGFARRGVGARDAGGHARAPPVTVRIDVVMSMGPPTRENRRAIAFPVLLAYVSDATPGLDRSRGSKPIGTERWGGVGDTLEAVHTVDEGASQLAVADGASSPAHNLCVSAATSAPCTATASGCSA